MKYEKECRFYILLLVILMCFSKPEKVYAYDLSADHKVNLYYQDSAKIKEIQKIIWAEMRTWKITEAGCAGIIGNMMAESSCDFTRMQNNVPWTSFKKGGVGIGLTQWTYPTRQDELFAVADSMNKQWTDLGVQLTQLKNELSNGYDIMYSSNSVDECSDYFLNVYEKPAHRNTAARRALSNTVYTELKGTKAKKYSGMGSIGNADEDTEDGEETTEGGETGTNSAITDEWQLVGLPSKSLLTEKQEEINLPTSRDLDIREAYSVSKIGDSLNMAKKVMTYDNARVAIVFIGIWIVVYAVLLFVALLFDKANSFIDVSLISVLSLGVLTYSDDTSTIGEKGYTSTTRTLIVCVCVLAVGLFIISGGVLPVMMGFVYNIIGSFL